MPNAFSQLASLTVQYETRRRVTAKLDGLLSEVKRSGRIVEGERALLTSLQEHLRVARELLARLADCDDGAIPALLTQFQVALDDVDWEVAEDLNQKLMEQGKLIADLAEKSRHQLAEWDSRLKPLERELARVRSYGARLIEDEIQAQRLRSKLDALRRILNERDYSLLDELIADLQQDAEASLPSQQGWSQALTELQSRGELAGQFATQADLLLLRSPSKDKCYEYTVLLRTPSRPGSHGVNIQGASRVVEQSREALSKRIDQITDAIRDGMLRALGPCPDVAPPGIEPDQMVKGIGQRLYRLLLPQEMQEYLEGRKCSVTITTNDLELPWELMMGRREALCLERPVGRMPMGLRFPRGLDRLPAPGARKRFLLIGDPMENLPGARAEINAIAEALSTGEEARRIETVVLAGQDATGDKIDDYLLSGEIDVIHYSGHAAFDKDRPELSALLLHGGEAFSAERIHRLVEGRPLVFLNACRSGMTGKTAENLDYVLRSSAEGLASAFVYGGALGCVASMWPIYDEPAADFAIAFYRKALNGEMIGEALRQARISVRKQHSTSITWAAFVLFGDPTVRMFG